MIDLNDKMVELLLNEWKERLGLQDWVIVVRYNCKFEDLDTSESVGETLWATSIKNATIRIVSKEEYGDDRTLPFDFEKILVHELLHCKFSILDVFNGSYESKVLEETRHQLIDDLARALVMAKRGETKRKLENGCEIVRQFNKPKKEIEITPLGSTTKEIISE